MLFNVEAIFGGVIAVEAAAFAPGDPKLLAANFASARFLRNSKILLNKSIICLILSCNASASPEIFEL